MRDDSNRSAPRPASSTTPRAQPVRDEGVARTGGDQTRDTSDTSDRADPMRTTHPGGSSDEPEGKR